MNDIVARTSNGVLLKASDWVWLLLRCPRCGVQKIEANVGVLLAHAKALICPECCQPTGQHVASASEEDR